MPAVQTMGSTMRGGVATSVQSLLRLYVTLIPCDRPTHPQLVRRDQPKTHEGRVFHSSIARRI